MDHQALNKEFQKAQGFITKFGQTIQQNNADMSSKYLSFAMGHFEAILSKITPKDRYTVKTKEPIVVKPVEKLTKKIEVEFSEDDFIISID